MNALTSSVGALATEPRPVTNGHATSNPRQSRSTQGAVNYLLPSENGEPLYLNVYEKPENGKPVSNLRRKEHTVDVTDIRSVEQPLTLEKNGFVLKKLQVPKDINWQDEKDVQARLYPEVSKVLKEETGATRVHIFDHTLRLGHLKKQDDTVGVSEPGQPVGMVHVDYNEHSGIDRLNALLPDEADRLRKTPFAIIQIWRPIRGPVKSSPLGMIDASSVAKEDLVSYAIQFPGRLGWNLGVHYNPNHKWYYAKEMEADEAYLFVCYDSRMDRARFTPHTGFRDLAHGDGLHLPPRESVELRSYVFWEDHQPRELVREI